MTRQLLATSHGAHIVTHFASTRIVGARKTAPRNRFTITVDRDESVLQTAVRFYLMARRSGETRYQSMCGARSVFRIIERKGYISMPFRRSSIQ